MMQVCLNQFNTAAERKCIPERWWCLSSRPSCVPRHANATVTAPHQSLPAVSQHAQTYTHLPRCRVWSVNSYTDSRPIVLCVCVGGKWTYLNVTMFNHCKDNRARLSISERTFIAEDLNADPHPFICIQHHYKHESVRQRALTHGPAHMAAVGCYEGKWGAKKGRENLRGWVKKSELCSTNTDITSAMTHTCVWASIL